MPGLPGESIGDSVFQWTADVTTLIDILMPQAVLDPDGQIPLFVGNVTDRVIVTASVSIDSAPIDSFAGITISTSSGTVLNTLPIGAFLSGSAENVSLNGIFTGLTPGLYYVGIYFDIGGGSGGSVETRGSHLTAFVAPGQMLP